MATHDHERFNINDLDNFEKVRARFLFTSNMYMSEQKLFGEHCDTGYIHYAVAVSCERH